MTKHLRELGRCAKLGSGLLEGASRIQPRGLSFSASRSSALSTSQSSIRMSSSLTAEHVPYRHDDLVNGAQRHAVEISSEASEVSTHLEGGINLRPYQHEAIAACLSALKSGLTRIGVSSPTGSGKTVMFMELASRVRATPEAYRTLILVSSVELANQAERAAKRVLNTGWKVEVEQGSRRASGMADVYVL